MWRKRSAAHAHRYLISTLPDCTVNPILAAAGDKIRNQLNSLSTSVAQQDRLSTQDLRRLEQGAAEIGAEVGAIVLTAMLERQCEQIAMADIASRGLRPDQVRWRREDAYYYSVCSTLGTIQIWLAAYRFKARAGCWVTCVPARGLVVARHRIRSTPLALEWECRLAALHPFRQGAGLLHFFSRGKLRSEDNTMARHAVAVGNQVSCDWKFRRPESIAELLRTRATRCRKTGLPLVYFSSDAHCIRQYEGATWAAPWKNINGVRLWCQDRKTGRIIHLGGDFTTGDCVATEALVRELKTLGILPDGGVYPGGVASRLVIITDGAPWLRTRLEPLLPHATCLLDAYHAFEYLGEYAANLYGTGTPTTKQFYATLYTELMGRAPPARRKRARPRSQPRKRRRVRRREADHAALKDDGFGIDGLIEFLRGYIVDPGKKDLHAAFLKKLEKIRTRMDYLGARSEGLQIGSGAMESIHRNGSQLRLKLPGARWRPEAAQAMINLRMLEIAGRWDEFWGDVGLEAALDSALGRHQPRVKRAA